MFNEHLFACLTRKRDSKAIIQYFVSPIYGWLMPRHFINARFVFTYDINKDLEVIALAEEAAGVDNSVIENTHAAYYQSALKRNFPSGMIPVCLCRRESSQPRPGGCFIKRV